MTKGNVMIDIETLSTRSNASILAVAMRSFDIETGQLYEGRQFKVNDNDWCGKLNRHVDPDTLKWWMKHSDTFNTLVAEGTGTETVPLRELPSRVASFIGKVRGERGNVTVWGNGSVFDITILQTLFEELGAKLPWSPYEVNDVRSVVALNPYFYKRSKALYETAHLPLDDCDSQIEYLSATVRSLNSETSDDVRNVMKTYSSELDGSHGVVFRDKDHNMLGYLYREADGDVVMWYDIFHHDVLSASGEDEDCITHGTLTFSSAKVDLLHNIKMEILDGVRETIERALSAEDDNIYKELRRQTEKDGGKVVSFTKVEGREGELYYLVGASSTTEDNYWLIISKHIYKGEETFYLLYNTCVDGYEVREDEQAVAFAEEVRNNFVTKEHLEDFVKQEIAKGMTDVPIAINVGDFNKN